MLLTGQFPVTEASQVVSEKISIFWHDAFQVDGKLGVAD
jgi:hypothetical protein